MTIKYFFFVIRIGFCKIKRALKYNCEHNHNWLELYQEKKLSPEIFFHEELLFQYEQEFELSSLNTGFH